MFDPILDTVPVQRHIVVCGTGTVSRASVTALIEDLHSSYGEDTIISVLLTENQSEAAMHVGEWALDFYHPLRVLSTIKGDVVAGRLTIGALNSRQKSLWVSSEYSSILAKPSEILRYISKNDVLCVAYDENDIETMQFITVAIEAGIPTMDLTHGLADIGMEGKENSPG